MITVGVVCLDNVPLLFAVNRSSKILAKCSIISKCSNTTDFNAAILPVESQSYSPQGLVLTVYFLALGGIIRLFHYSFFLVSITF